MQNLPYLNTPWGGTSEPFVFFSLSQACFQHNLFLGVRERSQEQCVRETCEASLLLSLHPRSSLTLILQVLHDDGSVSFSKRCCAVKLMEKLQVRALKCCPDGVSWWVYVLICSSALVLLFERRLHGSYGRRLAYELPVLWSDLCDWRRWSNHHRSHSSSGKGKSGARVLCICQMLC